MKIMTTLNVSPTGTISFFRAVSELNLTNKHNSGGACLTYVVGSKIFRADIQKPRQIENAVRDI